MNKRKTTEQFIIEAIAVHNNKYDYSKVIYKNNKADVIIICPKHGEFSQGPKNHLKGYNCKKCSEIIRIKSRTGSLSNYINKLNKIHYNYYNYSKFVYINYDTNSEILCPKHGSFFCNITNHIKGRGCPKCKRSKGELTISIWLDKNNIQYVEQKRFPDCKNIRTLPFDFYLPKQNIIIEFHGEQHFKKCSGNWSRHDLKYRQKLDKIKRDYCLFNNIKLLEINYKENIILKLKNYENFIS